MKTPAPPPNLGDMTLVDASWVLRCPTGCWLDLCLAFRFLDRRLLSCQRSKEEHTYAGGEAPHTKGSPGLVRGSGPPNLGWRSHPNVFSRETTWKHVTGKGEVIRSFSRDRRLNRRCQVPNLGTGDMETCHWEG